MVRRGDSHRTCSLFSHFHSFQNCSTQRTHPFVWALFIPHVSQPGFRVLGETVYVFLNSYPHEGWGGSLVSFDLKEMEAFSRRHQNLIERILVTLYILSSGGPRLISSLPMNRARVRVWVLASAVYFYSRQVLRFFSFNDEVYSKSVNLSLETILS